MTVHARQLARICRERMTSQTEDTLVRRQPEQQQQAVDTQPAQTERRQESLR